MDSETPTMVIERWRSALGYVPGEHNGDLLAQLEGSRARLPEFSDSA